MDFETKNCSIFIVTLNFSFLTSLTFFMNDLHLKLLFTCLLCIFTFYCEQILFNKLIKNLKCKQIEHKVTFHYIKDTVYRINNNNLYHVGQ